MALFVLVHGAWHGGWCWNQTVNALRILGHDAHAPTLTGVGERSHLLTADITPDTHVTDIINTLMWRDLRDVILVGHSYGGMVITGVASQKPDRVKALVYLDAFVPEESGSNLFSKSNPQRMVGFLKQIEEGAIALQPDQAIDTWAAEPATKQWLLEYCTPHPKGCFEKGVTLSGREREVAYRHYIVAGKNVSSPFQAEYTRVRDRDSWTSEVIPTLHDAMVEDPEDLSHRLDRYAMKIWQTEAV